MPDVAIEVNGRSYRVACGEGEEPRLRQLAKGLNDRVTGLAKSFGQVGESQLLLVASLLMADELEEAKAAANRAADGVDAAAIERMAGAVEGLAARLEAIAADLEAA